MAKKIISLFLTLTLLLQPCLAFADEVQQEQPQKEQEVKTTKDNNSAADPCNWGFPHRKGVVLVLSGGGMRGLAHIGIIEVLEREHIPIAAIVGTSMGSIIGALYACGYTCDEMKDIISKIDFMSVLSGKLSAKEESAEPGRLPLQSSHMLAWNFDFNKKNPTRNTGILSDKDILLLLQNLLSQGARSDFNRMKYPFAAVATNLLNGKVTAFRSGNLVSAVRASMALPVIYSPWEIDGQLYIDGGLKANMPVLQAKELFPGHPILAINVVNSSDNLKLEDIKTDIDVAMASIDIFMNVAQEENEKAADLIIAPDLTGINTLSDKPPSEIIDRGRVSAEAHLAEIKNLTANLAEHKMSQEELMARENHKKRKNVAEINFSGVNEYVEYYLLAHYKSMIGKPLSMKRVTRAITEITDKFGTRSASIMVRDIDDDNVALDFKLDFPPPYKIYLDGFASNTFIHRWLALGLSRRDLIYPNDKLSLEARIGTEWGIFLDYDTPQGFENTSWNWSLSAQEENYDIQYFYPRSTQHDFEYSFKRYSARFGYKISIAKYFEFSLGYQAQALSTNQGDMQRLEENGLLNEEQQHGPLMSLTINQVDDVALPTKGLKFSALAWYTLKDDFLMTRSALNIYIPAFTWGQFMLHAGLKTGEIRQPAFAVLLGAENELYSLGKNPVLAGEAFWLHFGLASQLLKTWWGGIQAEAFANYGAAMNDWSKFFDQWEVGLSLSAPFMSARNSFYVVYSDDGEFIFGYTIGTPRFRHGF